MRLRVGAGAKGDPTLRYAEHVLGMLVEVCLCEIRDDASFQLSRWKQSTESSGSEVSYLMN